MAGTGRPSVPIESAGRWRIILHVPRKAPMQAIFLGDQAFFLYAALGALLIMAVSFLRRTRDKYPDVCVAVGLPVLMVLMMIPQWLTLVWHPHTVDALLYRADLSLGLDPLTFARLVYSHYWLKVILFVAYSALPLVICVAWAAERPRAMFPSIFVAAGMAFVCYNVLPAVGPAHVFAGFPFAAPHLIEPGAWARNCVPSMHVTWSLLILWNVRGRVMKSVAWIFVALTGLATIGLGEHYFVDLIAAVPFSWAVQWVTERRLTQRPVEVKRADVDGVCHLPVARP
jgi:hypothetical protein